MRATTRSTPGPATELPPPPRWLRLGARGRDVLALERALRRAGLLPKGHRADRTFDEQTDAAVRAFQAANGLAVDGVVGPQTYGALGPFYDARGRWLVAQVRPLSPEPDAPLPAWASVRLRIVLTAHLGVEKHELIRYTQGPQRMDGVRRGVLPPAVPTWEDCSSFATWCYWAAGAPDPNGRGYDGSGYTGTQILHGVEVSEPGLGDLCFYGPSDGRITHVTVYVGNGRVVSHGREQGPELYGTPNYRRGRDLRQVRSYVP